MAKALTSNPFVGVSRSTSPDAMMRQINIGILDFIGAADPSIADPFLPQEGRTAPVRRYPGMHRPQHLHVGRHDRQYQPLHPEHRLHGVKAQRRALRWLPVVATA
ncbi:MAG: hypothetical protein WAT25_00840 [Paracoccaceae bacterium]